MKRELDLIDVWFDSGSMPYAQLHYPFENKDLFKESFPADFIAEGVDQTRGWFFTLHAISTLVFDSVAYKNVVSNGLVLDKSGNKMSKRLGNAVDPFITINKYGADATRWYMISNAQPWDNLKFDEGGILEVQRKFFGTLYNTYSFFSLYANIDNYQYIAGESKINKRDKTDKWIISELNSLIDDVTEKYENYEPTKATRLIQDFVINKLSNWYIRLNRRRFWKGEYNLDKKNAYSTLFECLEIVALISCPIAPFFMDNLYQDLHGSSDSIHLKEFPNSNKEAIDKDLEHQMQIAQKISSSILSLRKKEKVRVRQPLKTALITSSKEIVRKNINEIKNIILSETNLKKLELIDEDSTLVSKKAKPNFKVLGPKYGKKIKEICLEISTLNNVQIKNLEKNKEVKLESGLSVLLEDVDIISEDIEGYSVTSNDLYSVALDINISKELKEEGLARELVNRIQNIRKEKKFLVTDKICINIQKNESLERVIKNNLTYICNETLAKELIFTSSKQDGCEKIELIDNMFCEILIFKS
jgi:isoleucyl-tRNA synthetase